MASKESKSDEKPVVIPPGKKKRKDLPSVAYLLKHGDPETAHLPKSWCEIIGYPLVLAMVFALSLFIFHNAPWHKGPMHKKYTLPSMKNKQKYQAPRAPHINKENTEL